MDMELKELKVSEEAIESNGLKELMEYREFREMMAILKVMGGIYIGICVIQAIGIVAIAGILAKFTMFMQMTYYCR